MPHWTPEEIVQIIQAATPLMTAVGVIISAWNAHQIGRTKDRVKEVQYVIASKVDEVHACLADARTETTQAIAEAKSTAEDAKVAASQTSETMNRLEANTNNKMDMLLIASNAVSFQAGTDAEKERQK